MDMNLYELDRLQYSEKHKRYRIFEFYSFTEVNFSKFTEQCYIKAYLKRNHTKHNLLLRLTRPPYGCLFHVVLYSDKQSEPKIVCDFTSDGITHSLYDFKSLQEWFCDINNELEGASKILGKCEATGANSKNKSGIPILRRIFKNLPEDDGGLDITKKLLTSNTTKGFNLDLFTYYEEVDKFVIFEFLKRENRYVTVYTAHPMRYCWGKSRLGDNTQKFVSLWRAAQFLKAEFFLVNYSDEHDEGVGLINVINIDPDKGFRMEEKYNMTFAQFEEWMLYMNDLQKTGDRFLDKYQYIKKTYGEKFFDNWEENKRTYGL